MDIFNMNRCYTYFSIIGSFDPEEVTEKLGIAPERSGRIGDETVGGRKNAFSSWEIGRCEDYADETAEQMLKTLEPLMDKQDALRELNERGDMQSYLYVVPQLYAEDIAPSLAPSMEVIDFCHNTRTRIDIDLYMFGSDKSDEAWQG